MSAVRYESLHAIARSVLEPYAREDDDAGASAADRLHNAVHWSMKAKNLIEVGEGDDDRHNIYADMNQIGDESSLAIGFKIGLQIGALIARSPLEEIDVTAIVDVAIDEHFALLLARRMERSRTMVDNRARAAVG